MLANDFRVLQLIALENGFDVMLVTTANDAAEVAGYS